MIYIYSDRVLNPSIMHDVAMKMGTKPEMGTWKMDNF